MSNMSYCRFYNTVQDLEDCLDNLYDDLSSDDEIRSRKRLIKIAYKIVADFLDDNGELDQELIDELPTTE